MKQLCMIEIVFAVYNDRILKRFKVESKKFVLLKL